MARSIRAMRWAVAAAVAVAPLAVSAECKLKALELPVKLVDSRPIATIGLNGTQVPLLVDSGAFYSMLTEAAASQLQLRTRALPDGLRITGFTGTIQARLAKVEKVQLANGTIPNMEFITGLNEVGGGAMGVIGRNFLGVADTEWDLAHGMVRLVIPVGDCADTNMAYWATDETINVVPIVAGPHQDRSNTFLVGIGVNGTKAKALLDTGAPESSLTLSAAKDAGITESGLSPNGFAGGGGSGHAKTWLATIARLDVGGERIEHNQLKVVDTDWIDEDAILGLDYFLSHHIYVARKQEKLYATWNGGPVFVRNKASDAAPADGDAPVDADALIRRASASATRKDFVHALADLDRACALAPQDATCFATRARVRLALGNATGALGDLDEALRLDPARADARMERANARVAGHDRDGALADLRTLGAALPAQANLHAAMANAYAELDLPTEALRHWDLWLASHRHDAGRSWVLAGRCWMRMKLDIDLDRALADCTEAVDDNPGQAGFRDSLGWVLLRRGDLTKAAQEFDTAIASDPKQAWALYGRAIVRQRTGAAPAAAQDLAQARAAMADIDEQAKRHGMQAP